jgi:hypothetical protein
VRPEASAHAAAQDARAQAQLARSGAARAWLQAARGAPPEAAALAAAALATAWECLQLQQQSRELQQQWWAEAAGSTDEALLAAVLQGALEAGDPARRAAALQASTQLLQQHWRQQHPSSGASEADRLQHAALCLRHSQLLLGMPQLRQLLLQELQGLQARQGRQQEQRSGALLQAAAEAAAAAVTCALEVQRGPEELLVAACQSAHAFCAQPLLVQLLEAVHGACLSIYSKAGGSAAARARATGAARRPGRQLCRAAAAADLAPAAAPQAPRGGGGGSGSSGAGGSSGASSGGDEPLAALEAVAALVLATWGFEYYKGAAAELYGELPEEQLARLAGAAATALYVAVAPGMLGPRPWPLLRCRLLCLAASMFQSSKEHAVPSASLWSQLQQQLGRTAEQGARLMRMAAVAAGEVSQQLLAPEGNGGGAAQLEVWGSRQGLVAATAGAVACMLEAVGPAWGVGLGLAEARAMHLAELGVALPPWHAAAGGRGKGGEVQLALHRRCLMALSSRLAGGGAQVQGGLQYFAPLVRRYCEVGVAAGAGPGSGSLCSAAP